MLGNVGLLLKIVDWMCWSATFVENVRFNVSPVVFFFMSFRVRWFLLDGGRSVGWFVLILLLEGFLTSLDMGRLGKFHSN